MGPPVLEFISHYKPPKKFISGGLFTPFGIKLERISSKEIDEWLANKDKKVRHESSGSSKSGHQSSTSSSRRPSKSEERASKSEEKSSKPKEKPSKLEDSKPSRPTVDSDSSDDGFIKTKLEDKPTNFDDLFSKSEDKPTKSEDKPKKLEEKPKTSRPAVT